MDQVKAQIKAAEELGFTEWILWDPSLNYTEGALRSQGRALVDAEVGAGGRRTRC